MDEELLYEHIRTRVYYSPRFNIISLVSFDGYLIGQYSYKYHDLLKTEKECELLQLILVKVQYNNMVYNLTRIRDTMIFAGCYDKIDDMQYYYIYNRNKWIETKLSCYALLYAVANNNLINTIMLSIGCVEYKEYPFPKDDFTLLGINFKYLGDNKYLTRYKDTNYEGILRVIMLEMCCVHTEILTKLNSS